MKKLTSNTQTTFRPMLWGAFFLIGSVLLTPLSHAENSSTNTEKNLSADSKNPHKEAVQDKKALLEARKAERIQKREDRKNLLQNLSPEERATLKDEIRKAKKEKHSQSNTESKTNSKSISNGSHKK